MEIFHICNLFTGIKLFKIPKYCVFKKESKFFRNITTWDATQHKMEYLYKNTVNFLSPEICFLNILVKIKKRPTRNIVKIFGLFFWYVSCLVCVL